MRVAAGSQPLRALIVPVLVFCTQDSPHKRSEAFQAGAADYLVKPGDVAGVLDAVERLCGRAAEASA